MRTSADPKRTPRRIALGVVVFTLLALFAITGYSGGASVVIGANDHDCPNGSGYGYGYCPPPTTRIPAHFLHYELEPPDEHLESLTVADQFGAQRINLGEPEWLLNPTEKRRTGRPPEPIQRPEEHLLCYDVNKPQPTRTVAVSNQFGTATLQVGNLLVLCVPAAKSQHRTAGPPPTDLDHYLCYDVLSETPDLPSETLVVRDQFGQRTIRIDQARDLCNPAEKRRDGRPVEPILRPAEHLVCYRITTVSPHVSNENIVTNDQFGPRDLRVRRFFGSVSTLRRLCVPSAKS